MALLSADEERLSAALQQYSRGQTTATADHVQDSTTLVRCKETLELRSEAEEQGLFLAAKIVDDEQRALERLPSILRISPANSRSNAVKINPRETLE